ncbi:MAG: hypothetical protein ABIT01_15000 [Thermoanaerobaculia bacterium]
MSGLRTLDGFFDSLVQSFENCRGGLKDEAIKTGPDEPARFFADLYEKEVPRLLDVIRLQEPHLSPEARQEYFRTVDDLIRKVVLPAYLRLTLHFTPRERNEFYLFPEPYHWLERAGWAVVGIVLGAAAIAAPFIPLWEKSWILPFLVGGFFVPDVRRLLALRKYETELNRLVSRADREVLRIDTAYLTSGEPLHERGSIANADDARRRQGTAETGKGRERGD